MDKQVTLKVQMDEGSEVPAYGYPGDAGMDLAVCFSPGVLSAVLEPGQSLDLPTGIKVELPEGYWGRITGRSSTLRKRGLFVNEGVIDQGYRGELFVYVTNRTDHPVWVEHGDRLAQLILAPVVRADIRGVATVAESARGDKGFGSTGHREWTQDAQTPMDTPERLEDKDDTTEAVPVTFRGSVYLGGPIDYNAASPEDRHRRFVVACQMYGGGAGPRPLFDVYCPACRKRADETPGEAIQRNNSENRAREWGVFEYNAARDVSFGTPIEIWERFVQGAPTIVVGTLGQGLFGSMLRAAGVLEVESMQRAVQMIVDGPQ